MFSHDSPKYLPHEEAKGTFVCSLESASQGSDYWLEASWDERSDISKIVKKKDVSVR